MDKKEIEPILNKDQLPAVLASSIATFSGDVSDFSDQADVAVIDSTESYGRGDDLLKVIRDLSGAVEETRKELTVPLNGALKTINDEFRPYSNKLKAANKQISDKMLRYRQDEQKRIDEENAKRRREEEEKALEMAENAKTEEEQDIILNVAAKAKVQEKVFAPVSTLGGSSHTTKRWEGSVDDPIAIAKAIGAGDLPISVIASFSKSEMNKIAKQDGKEGVIHGIKRTEKETLKGRG